MPEYISDFTMTPEVKFSILIFN